MENKQNAQKQKILETRPLCLGAKECAVFGLSLFCFSLCVSRQTMTMIIMTVIFKTLRKIQCCQSDLSVQKEKEEQKNPRCLNNVMSPKLCLPSLLT